MHLINYNYRNYDKTVNHTWSKMWVKKINYREKVMPLLCFQELISVLFTDRILYKIQFGPAKRHFDAHTQTYTPTQNQNSTFKLVLKIGIKSCLIIKSHRLDRSFTGYWGRQNDYKATAGAGYFSDEQTLYCKSKGPISKINTTC